MKKKICRLFVTILMLAAAQGVMAQPDFVKVTFSGAAPTVKDFAACYALDEAADPFFIQFANELKAGTHKSDNTETVDDPQNGYASYDMVKEDGSLERIEMCYWNCNNKKEKIVGINHLNLRGETIDESYVIFYRYSNAAKSMRRTYPPFSKKIAPLDWVVPGRTSQEIIEYAGTVASDDNNAWSPIYTFPREGKDITVRIADGSQLPLAERQNYIYEWNGNGFTLKRID